MMAAPEQQMESPIVGMLRRYAGRNSRSNPALGVSPATADAVRDTVYGNSPRTDTQGSR